MAEIRKERTTQIPPGSRVTVTSTEIPVRTVEPGPAGLPLRTLMRDIADQAILLARKEVQLAVTEARADMQAEISALKRVGIAALFALLFVNMLMVTGALALALVLPAWAAGLIVSGVLLLVALVTFWLGWKKRVTRPLQRTRTTVKDDVRWTKERVS
jgi:uncharacterized membrane protein YqjE